MLDEKRVQETVLRISGVNPRKCMKCGKCSATCPSYDVMEYHPHEFVAMVEAGEIAPLLKSDSLYKCLSCMACVERCPRGVEPGKLVEAIRLCAVRAKGGERLTPNDIPELLDDEMPQQAIVTAFRKYLK